MSSDLRTPTDVLISAMEDIQDAEDLLIVWREKDEEGLDLINWRISHMPIWRGLGLMETAKLEMVKDILSEDD
jgi:hypothetical protein